TGAETLLRVTGDSPLIDPGFTDMIIAALHKSGGDFVVMAPGALCAHEGVDVFSRKALDWLTSHAADDPVAREHVTSYFKLHPEGIQVVTVPAYEPLAVPYERISVDTVDDLMLVRALYKGLKAAPGELKLADALRLMREDPSYRLINAHVRQKAIKQKERHALICCQAGRTAGLGHLRRSLSLARALRDREGFGVLVGVKDEGKTADLIRTAGFEAVSLKDNGDLKKVASSRNFSLAILDVKDWLARSDVNELVQQLGTTAVIDDGSDRRLAATHAYYPPVPGLRELSWAGSPCQVRTGWDWCVLGFDPGRLRPAPRKKTRVCRVVVSMGGADPMNLTIAAADGLAQVKQAITADFIIGPAFCDPELVRKHVQSASPSFRAVEGRGDPASLFAGADLALIAFGVTAYEIAALGIPGLYISLSSDHARSASAFEETGLGVALPQHPTRQDIAAAAASFLNDAAKRRAMAEAGPRLVDGKGACRIAAELALAAENVISI
ncbi:MAG: hypothetical protein ACREFW_03305, partial [Rhizomicrobium sp.]